MSVRKHTLVPRGPVAAHLRRGERAETLAERWLAARGARLLARNFRVRVGEIDLVALHEGCLVAVEVRYRARTEPLDPLATVTRQKCRRLMRALECFVTRHPGFADRPMRFDVLGISGDLADPAIEWHIGAFDTDDLR